LSYLGGHSFQENHHERLEALRIVCGCSLLDLFGDTQELLVASFLGHAPTRCGDSVQGYPAGEGQSVAAPALLLGLFTEVDSELYSCGDINTACSSG
jgi:hypothetical protein